MKTKLRINKWTGGTLAGLSLMSISAVAQEVVQDPASGEVPNGQMTRPDANAEGRQPINATAGVSEQFYSKLKDQSTAFSVTRFNIGAGMPVQMSENVRMDATFRYGMDSYNWSFITPTTNPSLTPWHNINTIALASVLHYKVDDQWSVYGGGFVRMSSDSDIALSKGTTYGGLVGFNYKVNDDLSLGLGIGAMTRIQRPSRFLPIFSAKWKFASDWLLTAGLSDVATTGYGAEVKWLFNDDWDFGLGAQYHDSMFRIPPPGSPPPASGGGAGVGEEKSGLLYASATWHANSKIDVTGFAGVTVGGMVDIYDSAGNELGDNKYDPALVIGLKGSMKF